MYGIVRNFFGNRGSSHTKPETTPKVEDVSNDEEIQQPSVDDADTNTKQEDTPKNMSVSLAKESSKEESTPQVEEQKTGESESKELDKKLNKGDEQEDTNDKEDSSDTTERKEVDSSSNETMSDENSGVDAKPDTQTLKTDEVEPPNRSQSDYEKDRYVKQVEGEYLSQLTELAKQASKQILNEAIDTIIENLMYPKILKNLDDAFIELAIEEKVDALIEKKITAYVSKELTSILPELVNQKVQEETETIIYEYVKTQVPQITETYCTGKFAEKFDAEVRKYLDQHKVTVDYLENYKQLYIDISKLVKLIDDTNLEEGKQAELENLLNNMLAKVLFQRDRWIKQEKNKKLEVAENEETATQN